MWPEIWNSTGIVQKYEPNKKFKDEPENSAATPSAFNVFVNEKDSFPSKLPKLSITNNQKKFFTFDNPCFVACCAAYCITYLSSILTKNFNDRTSNLISSISNSLFYYHISRFLRTPKKLKQHMLDKQIGFVQKHIPVKYIWIWEFDQTK